jgi:hypothetical protein
MRQNRVTERLLEISSSPVPLLAILPSVEVWTDSLSNQEKEDYHVILIEVVMRKIRKISM